MRAASGAGPVANTHEWAWFCSTKYPGDVHPNNRGHAVIARAFADVLAS